MCISGIVAFKYFAIVMFLSQLYDAQELQMYNKCMNELRKTTASSLNAVAVALLNKVSPLFWKLWQIYYIRGFISNNSLCFLCAGV